MHGRKIARVLERAPQCERASGAAVIVFRRPTILIAATADRRQRDLLILDKRVGLQSSAERGKIAQRLDGGAGLAHRLRGAVELAERVGEASRHRQNTPALVLQYDNR